jgi:hypothetical protein
MPDLFLDIETAPLFTKEEYFQTKEKIDSGKLDRTSENKDLFWRFDRGGLTPFEGKVILITYKINNGHVFRLKEWEMGEKDMLKKFYDLVVDLQRGLGTDRLKIIGHNILRFDLFFIYNRMKHQKGLKHDVLAYAYGFPVKSTLGSGEIPHYFQEDYNKIIEYSEREFIYPELYQKIISEGTITKERLLDSINHYDELQKSLQSKLP